jgi:RNA polymerase sigma-70 factor (ECF subfamily)
LDETDESLMARIRKGDHTAFEHLVERHLRPIHAYAMRLSRSRSDADDLAQETFLRVWQRAETWRPGAVRVTTWLHRIAHNIFVDAWRRREPVESLDDDADYAADDGNPGTSPDRAKVLNKALDTLPLNQRTAVALALINGFSTDETAHIMGMSAHAVESLIARARRTLRQHGDSWSGREVSAA